MSQRTTNAARAQVRKQQQRANEHKSQDPASLVAAPRDSPGRTSFSTWLRYRFDLTLSRGSGALIFWLALVTLGFVIVTGMVLHGVLKINNQGGLENSFIEDTWSSLMHTLDGGTVTGDGANGWPYRWAALAITIAGIFIFSALIGLIASVIDRAIENLRKGRGVVPEHGHTLILGWSEKLHTIISELQIANENQRSSCVVVLAPRDRVEMEDEINARRAAGVTRVPFARLKGMVGRGPNVMRVVCRTGHPSDPNDLAITSPKAAKSIIVLTDEQAESPDAQTTKVLLSLMSFDRELDGMHVVAEFVDAENAEALREATGGNVATVVSSDLIARITAQICRQSGLGAVYQELLDFDGDEVYFHDSDELDGRTWAELLTAYSASSPMGVRREDGSTVLNPAPDYVLARGDQVIAISEDDDTLVLDLLGTNPATNIDPDRAPAPELEPDHLLMMGWNELSTRVLGHLSRAVPTGSTVSVVVDPALVSVTEGDLPASDNMKITLSHADTSRIDPLRDVLDAREFERIILVGYRQLPPEEADARTLLGLVQARRILDAEHRNFGTSIVAELLEPRSVELGQVANPDDFVVSERLTSLLLSQLSENGALESVFSELLDGQGVEITMRPIARYLTDDAMNRDSVPWLDVVREAAALGESAIGTVIPGAGQLPGGVTVNPNKSTPVAVTADTQIIVIA